MDTVIKQVMTYPSSSTSLLRKTWGPGEGLGHRYHKVTKFEAYDNNPNNRRTFKDEGNDRLIGYDPVISDVLRGQLYPIAKH